MLFPKFDAKNKWFWATFFFPLIIDFFNAHYYDYSIPTFLNLFKSSSETAGWVILGFYVLFILSLLSIGWLAPYKKYNQKAIDVPVSKNSAESANKLNQWLFIYTSAGFGIIILMLILHASGLYDEMVNTNELSSSKEWIFWIAVGLFFVQLPATIGFSPKYRIGTFQYFIVFAVNVLIAALLVSLSTAGFIYFLAGDVAPDPNRSGKLIEFLVFFILYFFFFAQPRLLFMGRGFSWLSLISAIITMSWFLWNALDIIEL